MNPLSRHCFQNLGRMPLKIFLTLKFILIDIDNLSKGGNLGFIWKMGNVTHLEGEPNPADMGLLLVLQE